MIGKGKSQYGLFISFFSEVLQSGFPGRNQGNFRHRKKTIEEDQEAEYEYIH